MSEIELSYKADGDGTWTNLRSSKDISKHHLVCFDKDATAPGWVEDCDADSLNQGPCIGLTLGHMTVGSRGAVLLFGWVRIPDKSWDQQVPLYVSNVPGELTATDPGGAYSQQVAVHDRDGWILFRPLTFTINL